MLYDAIAEKTFPTYISARQVSSELSARLNGAAPSLQFARRSPEQPSVEKQAILLRGMVQTSQMVVSQLDDHSPLRAQPHRRACNINSLCHLVKFEDSVETYAKEKLSTFCTDATALPSMVIFVIGVLCSVALPYHFMARTAA